MALKRLPVVGQDQGTWGQLLNDNLKQISDVNKGGINVWTTSTRPTGLVTDDEGRTGVNKDTGKIERWTGAAWEVMGEQIITPYVSGTGTYQAYYTQDQILHIDGVGTKFTDFKPGDVIVRWDGTNLGSRIEFEKIIDDTHAFGSIDVIQNRIFDKTNLGTLNVDNNTKIYTVPSTTGLAVGDYIDYVGLYYGDFIMQIIDSTHFLGRSPIAFGNQYSIVAYKLPRAGSQYKVGKTSFSITDVLDGSTKMTVSDFRTKFDNVTTDKINLETQNLIDSDLKVGFAVSNVNHIKNNFPSLTQNWIISNYVEASRNTTLPKYPASTVDTGRIGTITNSLFRVALWNFSTTPARSITNAMESVRTEFYSLGKAGVVQQYTGLVVGGIAGDADAEVHRRIGINVAPGMDNIYSGRNGFNTGSPAALIQASGDVLFDGGASSQLISDPNFENSGTGFTFGAGWGFENYTDTLGQWSEKWARHTPGNTASLSYDVTLNNSKFYVVLFTVKNTTAGSVQFSMGGSSPQQAVNNIYNVYKIQPSSSAPLTITPTTDFNGAIDDVLVYEYNPDSGRNITFGRIGVNTLSPSESIDVVGNIKTSGKIKAPGLQNFADNTAALGGGLVQGDMYHTNGTVKVVI
jgi:hypothetical protein